jgi:hypothetical protein
MTGCNNTAAARPGSRSSVSAAPVRTVARCAVVVQALSDGTGAADLGPLAPSDGTEHAFGRRTVDEEIARRVPECTCTCDCDS